MKILALTDIHGAYGIATEIIRRESPDVVIIGGDLTTVGSIKEAEQAVQSFKNLSEYVMCVAGNMDLPQHDDLFVRLNASINGRGVIINSVGFFGVSGAPHSHLHTPYEISEEEIFQRSLSGYKEVKNCARTIFVPHAPPYGTRLDIIHTGIHVGSTAIREFVEDAQPTVVVCGHIHEARGQDQINNSLIVNCGMASRGYFSIIDMQQGVNITLKQVYTTS